MKDLFEKSFPGAYGKVVTNIISMKSSFASMSDDSLQEKASRLKAAVDAAPTDYPTLFSLTVYVHGRHLGKLTGRSSIKLPYNMITDYKEAPAVVQSDPPKQPDPLESDAIEESDEPESNETAAVTVTNVVAGAPATEKPPDVTEQLPAPPAAPPAQPAQPAQPAAQPAAQPVLLGYHQPSLPPQIAHPTANPSAIMPRIREYTPYHLASAQPNSGPSPPMSMTHAQTQTRPRHKPVPKNATPVSLPGSATLPPGYRQRDYEMHQDPTDNN